MRWERRWAFLLGLTGTAGALDALAFLLLGKVFASFQSGNVLFLGLGLGDGNMGLVLRAGVVLLAFVLGTAAGAHLVGVRLAPRGASGVAIELRVVAVELVLLLVFAAVWLAAGTPADQSAVREVLLALGAAAMGVQASLSLALKVPNVLTVALTATLANLGQRLGVGRAAEGDQVGTPLLAALLATYVVCALLVALLPSSPWLALLPAALLVAGVAVDVRRQAVARPSRAAGARGGAEASSA
jgi:uncharacterized membrane protein YoaK (UPF0700 family)